MEEESAASALGIPWSPLPLSSANNSAQALFAKVAQAELNL